MRLAMHRIDDHDRMYRIAENSTAFWRRRSAKMLAAQINAAALVRKKHRALMNALTKSGCQKLRVIEVEVSEKSVLLRGRVDSFYLKQLAQEAVRPSASGLRIVNRIEVA